MNNLVDEERQDKVMPKKVAKNLIMVFFSNFATILSGVLVGFFVPKMMSVSDYGFYKTYTLYATYIGLFHFGFSDGVYTFFSGKDFNELNKGKFRVYSRFIILLAFIISVITILIGLFVFKNEYSIVFIFLGANIFATHLTLYFQGIVQCTSRFKELSIKNFTQSIINIVAIITLFVLFKLNYLTNLSYSIYLCVVTAVNYLIAIWYCFKYKSIIFGKQEKPSKDESIGVMIKVGLPVLISNLIGTLIMTIDRQFISVLYENEVYAIYAFAYNMLSLVTVAVSAISVVIFPTLKQIKSENIKDNYSFLNSTLLILVFFALVVYFILDIIVSNFITNYVDSLPIFRVIFPGIVLTSSITIIMYNIYKTFSMTLKYFFISLAILLLSIIANLVAYFLFKTPLSISIVSVIVISIWYIVTEIPLMLKFKIKPITNYIYIAVMMASFYLVTTIKSVWIGILVYLVIWILFTLLLQFKELKKLLKLLISLIKK